MNDSSRRSFIANTGKVALAGGSGIFVANNVKNMAAGNIFIHHVFFWLKNPSSAEDKAKLIEALKKLSKVTTIKSFHIGVPASTNRDVIEKTYSISWMLTFDSLGDEETYQHDPIHLNFVKENQALWTKVIVYDSVNA
jgi:Stress responsive A/B Barrel Domain